MGIRYHTTIKYYYSSALFSKSIVEKRKEKWVQKKYFFKKNPKHLFGISLFVNPNDDVISAAIAVDGVWEASTTYLLRKIIKNGMFVVNIGANIGYYTLMAAEKVGKHGRVIAFEPEPLNFNLLRHYIEYNHFNNVLALPIGLSDKIGKTKLFLNKSNPGGHTILPLKNNHFLEIDLTTLDHLFYKEKIDLLLIDVEGAESAVIKGGINTIKKNIPKIILEYNCASWVNEKELLSFLFMYYNIYKINNSPFILKKVTMADLSNDHHRAFNLYLTPKYKLRTTPVC